MPACSVVSVQGIAAEEDVSPSLSARQAVQVPAARKARAVHARFPVRMLRDAGFTFLEPAGS